MKINRWGKSEDGYFGDPQGDVIEQNPSLAMGIVSTCDEYADYSEFGYNHCEQRGSYNSYGDDHAGFTCPNSYVENEAFPGTCFSDITGDPESDCVWDTWECDPETNDPQGLCLPWDEIAKSFDMCGQCDGDGASCSALGYCDQNTPPSYDAGEWNYCVNWGVRMWLKF